MNETLTATEVGEAPVRTDLGLQPPLNGRIGSDPAPDPIDTARQRAQDLVHNIATNTLLDLGKRRDELDNCMARITTSEQALARYITEFARFNYEALELSQTIAADIAKVTEPFAGSPPATLTQGRNGGNSV